ncbi:hypothetical protein [Paracholeplasma manati]|uniref:hypothetical protein n=1 Tax=Paracholeplasma manati TaxID=591373 RepID=UPI0024077CFC|nr:hypothetical protein [Paracholeplasma manati]MDG0888784.1 hypothetical protein [Paracholeplasma manati]
MDLLWKGLQYIMQNPDQAVIWAIIIISAFLVKPLYEFLGSVWESFKLILTKPRGFLLWIVLTLVGYLLLKSYGVI